MRSFVVVAIPGKNLSETNHVASEVLRALVAQGLPALPRIYEVWFAHLNGDQPSLSEYINRKTAEAHKFDIDEIEKLYDTYINATRFSRQAERTSIAVMCEMDGVMRLVETALGTSERYGASLDAISRDLDVNIDHGRLRAMIESMVLDTQEANCSNRLLETRLKDCHSQIGELREMLEVARAEALTDSLTGLANRRHFEEMLNKTIDQATLRRDSFALVMVDIDFFKRFNDLHSHATGDQVLRLVTRTMQEKFAKDAIVARYGGEEFMVILPGSDLVSGHAVAETVRQSLLTRDLIKRSTGESLGRITISLGVSVYRRGDTLKSIISRPTQPCNVPSAQVEIAL